MIKVFISYSCKDLAFERANLKSSDFYIQRWQWIWQACEAIRAADDHIDEPTIEKELRKAGHFEDVTAQHELLFYINPNTLPIEANARLVRDTAERRCIISGATEQARKAFDLNIPLPNPPRLLKTHWTLEELAAAEFPEPKGPIPWIIPVGLTVLGERPKRGKSWCMLQAASALGLGVKFLDHDLHLGKVLYYALENSARRLKERARKLGILGGPGLVDFVMKLAPLHLGGLATVEQAARHGGFEMIVIDTIRRAMPGKDFNKDGTLFDDILGKLQTLAQQCNLAIVVVLHTRKSGAGFDPDPVDDVLGSTGLTASADCVLALYTEQGKKGAVLKGRGRDLNDMISTWRCSSTRLCAAGRVWGRVGR